MSGNAAYPRSAMIRYSIIILYFNRPESLRKLHKQLSCGLAEVENVEVIVVDNCSDVPAHSIVEDEMAMELVE